MAVRITCINKDNGNHDNPHEAITNFGWIQDGTGSTGYCSLVSMVKYLDEDHGAAYVQSGQNKVLCYTRQGKYHKFVQTYADNTPTDNLLNLSECPR